MTDTHLGGSDGGQGWWGRPRAGTGLPRCSSQASAASVLWVPSLPCLVTLCVSPVSPPAGGEPGRPAQRGRRAPGSHRGVAVSEFGGTSQAGRVGLVPPGPCLRRGQRLDHRPVPERGVCSPGW